MEKEKEKDIEIKVDGETSVPETVDSEKPSEVDAAPQIKSGAPAPERIDLGENNPFEVIELIGQGGMGAVYKARNKQNGKLFAIKVLLQELADDTAAVKRFKQEADAAGKLNHANLANVFGHGTTDDGSPYLVMEYLEGKSLKELLEEEGRLGPDQALDIFIQVTEGLSYAHKEGIIHRDIKPSNVFLTKTDTGATIPKVLDFGIAQVRSSTGRETQDLTQTGAVFGSPQYMSPEQCLGFMLDERSDIYSLGCFIYEVLTGTPPFKGDNPIQLVVSHINEEAPGFKSELKAGATMKNLEKIALRCLSKEQADRYQTIEELTEDLEKVKSKKSLPNYKKGKGHKFSITRRQVITVVAAVCLLAGFLPSLLQDWFSYQASRIIQSCFFGMICIICSTTFLNIGIERLKERFKFQGTQRQWLNAAIPTMLGAAGFLLLLQFYRIFVPYGVELPIWADHILFWGELISRFLAFFSAIAFLTSFASRDDKKVSPAKPVILVGVLSMVTAAVLSFTMPKDVAKQLMDTARSAERPYPELAISLFETAHKMDPEKLYYNHGVLATLKKQKKFEEGLRKVDVMLKEKQALQKNQLRESLLSYRADFNEALGNKAEELKDINKIIELGGQRQSEYLNLRARRSANEGEMKIALSDLEDSIKVEPGYNNRAYQLRVNILVRMNKLDEALSEASKVAKFSSNKAAWYLTRALIYQKAGNTDKEYKNYKLALHHCKEQIAIIESGGYLPYRQVTDYESAAYAAEKLGKLQDRDMLLKKYHESYGNPKKTDLIKHLQMEKTGLKVDWKKEKHK